MELSVNDLFAQIGMLEVEKKMMAAKFAEMSEEIEQLKKEIAEMEPKPENVKALKEK